MSYVKKKQKTKKKQKALDALKRKLDAVTLLSMRNWPQRGRK